MSTTELKSKALLTGELPPVLPPPEHTTNFVDSDSLVVAVDVSDGEARFQKRAKELEVKKSEHHSQSALMDMPLDIIFEVIMALMFDAIQQLTEACFFVDFYPLDSQRFVESYADQHRPSRYPGLCGSQGCLESRKCFLGAA